ncbi:MAG TPA: PPOX class F420-dependent oxidoreductase [Anaerolineales bacterium]|nr:PPOX class F420-dependent oxidoreductase [Anaerolineales bacterium]
MSVFTAPELEYLKSQRLGRLATVDPQGRPQNAPVGFRYNPEADTIDIGGRFMSASKKFRNVQNHPQVAFVIDDILPPRQVRGIEIRGTAEALPSGASAIFGELFPDDAILRITPQRIIVWGLEGSPYDQHSRRVDRKKKE